MASQLANVLLGGSAVETLSSRLHRLRRSNKVAAVGAKIVNGMFFFQEDHVALSNKANKLRMARALREMKG